MSTFVGELKNAVIFNIYEWNSSEIIYGKQATKNRKVEKVRIGGEDYTAKLVVGNKNGYTYYDHALTKIEKNNLLRSIDEIKRPFASKETNNDEGNASNVLSECKDKRLISILQTIWDIFSFFVHFLRWKFGSYNYIFYLCTIAC